MVVSLVELLKSVDEIPDFVEVDKEKEHRKLLDEGRKKYNLVDRAVRGEISIPDTVEELLEPYKGWRLFLPIIKGRGYDERLGEYNFYEVIGVSSLKPSLQLSSSVRRLRWFAEKCMNPLVIGLFMGAFTIGISLPGGGRFESEIVNYFTAFGAGVLAGGFFGLLGSWVNYTDVDNARNNAKYLHEKIQELL